uniref:WAP domain-containing protein n=1 Tax=Gopherus evgoodei TaxID=1825980 RepID=A0A8C4XZJ3_9SAUR
VPAVPQLCAPPGQDVPLLSTAGWWGGELQPGRHSNQCLDDHVCERHEKCCDTGCRRECSEDKSGDGPTGACVDKCRADEDCPRGQRCRSNGCGRVCQDVSQGEARPRA